MRSQTYEITLTGQARTTLRAEFDDCKISTGPGTTTLRAELPDQGALCGLVQRIADLGLCRRAVRRNRQWRGLAASNGRLRLLRFLAYA